MNEFLEQFVIESRELIAQANQDLLALENRPNDKPRLDSAFRAFHTLKGGAGIVDFAAMGRGLHAAEDLLSAVRAGKRELSSTLISAWLASLDTVEAWLKTIEATDELPDSATAEKDADALLARFGAEAHATKAATGPEQSKLSDAASRIIEEQLQLLSIAPSERSPGIWPSAFAVAANVLRATNRAAVAEQVEAALKTTLETHDSSAIRARLSGLIEKAGAPATPVQTSAAETAPRTFRVDADRIEALVALTGELTVAKNALGHIAKLAQESGNAVAVDLRGQSALLDRLVGELQHAVLGMRVIPLRFVFQRLQRLVRELAVSLGKPARFVSGGDDTEADKAIVEALYEPLLHIIRNAMDHGIESPEVRAERKKPPLATIQISGARIGEHIVVEISDDGAGIDVEKVKSVAVARGLGSPESLAALGEAAVIDLIFEAGFSTAATVTAHSGRGVGMDAVRTAVEALGGRVSLESTPGQGTRVKLVLPFSAMMTQVLTVHAGSQVFGVPLDAVVETLRVPRRVIQDVGAGNALVHRDRTVPVLDLARTLDGTPGLTQVKDGPEATLLFVLSGGVMGALEVDRLGDRVEVMLKPMPNLLARMPGVIGTTLLGDGSVLIVLNPQTLFS
jgi:two-component system chemotaxis sensor kinase CheA